MKLIFNIDSDNEGCSTRHDLAITLKIVADRLLSSDQDNGTILDRNGNTVGKWELDSQGSSEDPCCDDERYCGAV